MDRKNVPVETSGDGTVSTSQPMPPERARSLLNDADVLEHLSDIVSIVDGDCRFLYVNRTAGGRSKSEVLGSSVLDHIPPASRDDFARAFSRAWNTGVPETIEASSNDDLWWENRLVPVHGPGGEKYMLVTTRDITPRRRAEQALVENEARLRSALDASGVGSWSWSMLSGQLVWDARMYQIWGLSSEQPPPTYADYLATLHPHDVALVKTRVEQCLASGVFEEFEHRILRPSGEVRHVLCRARSLADAHGNTIGMFGGVFDITDRKLLEERLRSAHRMEAVGQLTAGIAHNFNNLLSIILPNVEFCRTVPRIQLKGHLDDIEYAATRAAEMVRQLMQFARQDVGTAKASVAVGALVERTLSMCRTTFGPGLVMESSVPQDVPPILARAGDIKQVLLNICINARDALMQAETRDPWIRVSCERGEGASVRIQIEDNGPGMTSDVRARIFEPFFTTKGVGGGTGLGLSSTYGIIRDHDGTIVCRSEPGQGTSFTIELPSAPEPVSTSTQSAAAFDVRPNTETILLVDDERAVRSIFKIVLEHAGFHVLEAEDGEACLRILESQGETVSLVLLDRMMPRMSGEQTLLQLRRLHGQLPVVMVTGQPDLEASAKGVSAVVNKPPASGELVRTIRAVLDGTRRNDSQ